MTMEMSKRASATGDVRGISSSATRRLSKFASAELLIEANGQKISVELVQEPYMGKIDELRCYLRCRAIQQMVLGTGPVKAAIITLDSSVDVEEYSILVDENVTTPVITIGNYRIGVLSLYFESDRPIAPSLDRVKWVLL
ncbi:hypothetical protein EVAR_19314_1 [Eumeta japonica]|uniref:Uncharacterized protein n=1 Tax=Eumeta variegata TaxID=151549 RepID=A0A4C1UDI4_EUMVA|nr:hypothetical protein EVAR_19314_1 [Eumeta japonica]